MAADGLNDTWRGTWGSAAAVRRRTKLLRCLESGHAWPGSAHARRVADELVDGESEDAERPPPADALGAWKRAWYADGRARTLALGRSEVVATCGLRKLVLHCKCGPSVKDVGCGQIQLCDRCRRPYYRRIRRRALKAIEARLRDAHRAWAVGGYHKGGRPGIVLLTLTSPKELDGVELSLADRHRMLVDGWRRFRQWLHARIGRFAFVGLPELSATKDPRGHLHYHFICVWPWWDWTEAVDEWRRATGVPTAIAPDMRAVRSVKRAAHYVGKYATKGASANGPGMTAPLVGEFVASYYGKRRVLPSVGFWERRDPPACPCCGQPLVVTERPAPSADAAAAWRAMVELRAVRAATVQPIRDWLQVTAPW